MSQQAAINPILVQYNTNPTSSEPYHPTTLSSNSVSHQQNTNPITPTSQIILQDTASEIVPNHLPIISHQQNTNSIPPISYPIPQDTAINTVPYHTNRTNPTLQQQTTANPISHHHNSNSLPPTKYQSTKLVPTSLQSVTDPTAQHNNNSIPLTNCSMPQEETISNPSYISNKVNLISHSLTNSISHQSNIVSTPSTRYPPPQIVYNTSVPNQSPMNNIIPHYPQQNNNSIPPTSAMPEEITKTNFMPQQHSITDFISHQHNTNSIKRINHHMPFEFSNSISFQPTKTNLISKQSNHKPTLHEQNFNSIQTSNNFISDSTLQTHPINRTQPSINTLQHKPSHISIPHIQNTKSSSHHQNINQPTTERYTSYQFSSKDQHSNITPGRKTYSEIVRNTVKIGIFADSMPKQLNTKELNKHLNGCHTIKRTFPGSTAKNLEHYILPTLEEENLDAAIIHVGINDLMKFPRRKSCK